MNLQQLKQLVLDGPSDEDNEEEWALVLIQALRQYSATDLDDSRETFNYLLKCLRDLVNNGINDSRLGG